MKDFIYHGSVPILYGAGQMAAVVQEIAKLGDRVLAVPADSFLTGGHYEKVGPGAAGRTGKYLTCQMQKMEDVDRAAIARCMADMVADDALGANESLGITNRKEQV